MIRHCLLLLIALSISAIKIAPRYRVLPVSPAVTDGMLRGSPERDTHRHGQSPLTEAAKIETTYDARKDRTTVRLAPVKISGEIDKYHSLHMSPSFSFPGRQSERPSIIDFELQTIVKTRLLDTDLYVVFIIDSEKIHLSSNRSAIARPVPGRRWVGERLVFRMPYETFLKISNAKTIEIKFDGVKFEVGAPQMQSLRDFFRQII